MDPDDVMLQHFIRLVLVILLFMTWYYVREVRPRHVRSRKCKRTFSMIQKIPAQVQFLKSLTELSDKNCYDVLQMNRDSFHRFCYLLKSRGGLTDSRYVGVAEQVASFLLILGHHAKNRVIQFAFARSGQTVSTHFHDVLKAVLRLHDIVVINLEPVPNDCQDDVWKHFKGCLGALDVTYIRVDVKKSDHPRYMNRKGMLSVNVLGVCDRQMRFVYVLTGWEGYAADGRVLRDAISRPNGLRVPQGNYYLVDCGYANALGFLAPYRMIRYHLQEWTDGALAPQNAAEYFNMKHSSARNVIERTFGLLKKRWAILRSPSYYPIDTQNDIILACCLIHNYIRTTLGNDTRDHVEDESSDDEHDEADDSDGYYPDDDSPAEFIDSVNNSPTWTNWRDNLSTSIYNEWRSVRSRRRR